MNNTPTDKLRADKIPHDLLEPITNIAKNMGVTRAQFLRQQLRIIADKYPEKMKQNAPVDLQTTNLHLDNLNPEVKKAIMNICANLKVSQADFFKLELQKIVQTYPEDMKKPPLDF